MKPKLLLLLTAMLFVFAGICQYTPLPKLDEAEYNNFITALRVQAVQQDLPELNVIADKMTYEEARRFLANPHVFAEKLEEEQKKQADNVMDAVRIGIIVSVLFNHLTNLGDGVDSSPKFGYAFGLYALFALGTVYLIPELLFTFRAAGEKTSLSKNTLRISYITLFTTLVYSVAMNTCRWLIGAGPVFAFGVAGKQKYESGGTSGELELEFGDNGLRRFQAGLTLMTGFILRNRMLVYLGYSLFFTDLFSNGDVGMNMFRFGLGIPLNSL